MKKLLVICALSFSLATVNAMAEKKYGTAGCGLGSLLFGPGDGFSQVFAYTTNSGGTAQALSITTGTSNCEPDLADSTAMNNLEDWVPLFVEANREALAEDIARGQGETLKTMAFVLKCENSDAFQSEFQGNYENIFPMEGASDHQVSDSLMNIMRGNDAVKGACSSLS